jgi:hypothetical protein
MANFFTSNTQLGLGIGSGFVTVRIIQLYYSLSFLTPLWGNESVRRTGELEKFNATAGSNTTATKATVDRTLHIDAQKCNEWTAEGLCRYYIALPSIILAMR